MNSNNYRSAVLWAALGAAVYFMLACSPALRTGAVNTADQHLFTRLEVVQAFVEYVRPLIEDGTLDTTWQQPVNALIDAYNSANNEYQKYTELLRNGEFPSSSAVFFTLSLVEDAINSDERVRDAFQTFSRNHAQ